MWLSKAEYLRLTDEVQALKERNELLRSQYNELSKKNAELRKNIREAYNLITAFGETSRQFLGGTLSVTEDTDPDTGQPKEIKVATKG